MTNKTDLSRRQFIGIAGGIAGATALGAMASMNAFAAEPTENKPTIRPDEFKAHNLESDVLIIGGGIAGLFAAVKAHDAGAKVMMVSKGRLGSSGLTPFGKGVFCYEKEKAALTIDEFVAKVGRSALGTNNPVFTRQYAEHSYDRVQELKSWGFFDSPLCRNSFMTPMLERQIPLIEHVMMTHLHKEHGRIVGASGFSFRENRIYHFTAKTVILCTGSGGFKPNGFPMCDLTHDGTIMAYKIGAKITGKEWNDGHPGSAKNSGSCYDNWHGQIEEKPTTTTVEVHHDLGVEMNYAAYKLGGASKSMGPPMAGGPGSGDGKRPMGPPPMGDDGRPMGPPPGMQQMNVAGGPYIPAEFSGPRSMPERPDNRTVLGKLFGGEAHQGPPGMGGNMVGGSTAGMAIHKSEGLVPVDETGLTTIAGLWAAGDALGSMMSGGIYTQIGGSMAASAVQGAFAGEAAAKASQTIKPESLANAKVAQAEAEILAPLKRERGYSPAWVTQVLQGVMIPNFVLYIKKERMMQAALAYVEELKEHHVPLLMADDRHNLRLAHETENMILTAEMKLKASLERTESRCSHFRLDYPKTDTKNWQAWLNLWQDEKGNMHFEKQPFNTWPKTNA
jgi:succinate dehydrogenase/fumarate reductase flavoprotein subunit